jgi:hypothetical protein
MRAEMKRFCWWTMIVKVNENSQHSYLARFSFEHFNACHGTLKNSKNCLVKNCFFILLFPFLILSSSHKWEKKRECRRQKKIFHSFIHVLVYAILTYKREGRVQ